MKRLISLALLALLIGATAEAIWRYNAVSATATSQTITLADAGGVAASGAICNDGANEVYVQVFGIGEVTRAATTSDPEIKASEGCWRFEDATAISLVCAGGETATVRLVWR